MQVSSPSHLHDGAADFVKEPQNNSDGPITDTDATSTGTENRRESSAAAPVGHTMVTNTVDQRPSLIALRTVPVIVKNGNKKMKINAVFDEASSRTYINGDVAAQLGLEGESQEMKINVLNDNQETMTTSKVDFTIESLSGTVRTNATAYTTKRVTGELQVVDWQKQKSRWKHLQNIPFPTVSSRPRIDMLIGLDLSDLMYSLKDVQGQPGEPIARLTPLGWTCIGRTHESQSEALTNFTFFASAPDNNDSLLRRYWDIEEPKVSHTLCPDEKAAVTIASESMAENGHYKIAIPWKENKSALTNNCNMSRHDTVFQGPMLLKDDSEWPKTKIAMKSMKGPEVKKEYVSVETFITSQNQMQPNNYSDWNRFTRVHAWAARFLDSCSLPVGLRRKGPLQPDEIQSSELHFIKTAQAECFQEELRDWTGYGLLSRKIN